MSHTRRFKRISGPLLAMVSCCLLLASCKWDDEEKATPVYTSFTDLSQWEAFDPGEAGLGLDLKGFVGSVFDGRYMYMVPASNTIDGSFGKVARYDTQAVFTDVLSWQAFDPEAAGLASGLRGYNGGVFDGRHVYFVPNMVNGTMHGKVMRYDTSLPFEEVESWESYDLETSALGRHLVGFKGAVFDRTHIYLVAQYDDGVGDDDTERGNHGEFVRFNTRKPFADAASWEVFDPGFAGLDVAEGGDADGYEGAVFDGRYVYYVPAHNGTEHHGLVLRYEPGKRFDDLKSWTAFDPGAHGIGDDPDGFRGAVFDGRYVYFVPFQKSGTEMNGEVVRFDTTGEFDSPEAWSAFDPGASGVGLEPRGFTGGMFDGRFVYFIPTKKDPDLFTGEFMRYDSTRPFEDPSSWECFRPAAEGMLSRFGVGFHTAAFDGTYLYAIPFRSTATIHGEVVRFRVKPRGRVSPHTVGGSFY